MHRSLRLPERQPKQLVQTRNPTSRWLKREERNLGLVWTVPTRVSVNSITNTLLSKKIFMRQSIWETKKSSNTSQSSSSLDKARLNHATASFTVTVVTYTGFDAEVQPRGSAFPISPRMGTHHSISPSDHPESKLFPLLSFALLKKAPFKTCNNSACF